MNAILGLLGSIGSTLNWKDLQAFNVCISWNVYKCLCTPSMASGGKVTFLKACWVLILLFDGILPKFILTQGGSAS